MLKVMVGWCPWQKSRRGVALLLGVPLRSSKWDPARQGCRMGSGKGISAEDPRQGRIRGFQILPAPFVPLLLEAFLHSLLPSSLGERCTSVMSTPASA